MKSDIYTKAIDERKICQLSILTSEACDNLEINVKQNKFHLKTV